MVLTNEKLKQLNGEKPQYSDRYHRRAFKSKYQDDLIKGIVEIIKNGIDAYINDKGEDNCDEEEIKVILETKKRKNDIVKIVNFAGGMSYDAFKKALRVGEDTSGDKESVTGAHGYGMKEAAWAFKQTKIVTLHDGKYSTRIFYWDDDDTPVSAWNKDEKENEIYNFPIDEKIISETGIEKEGTYFEALIPEEISCPRPDTLYRELSNHILLRTINQSGKFNIVLEYKEGKRRKISAHQIKYALPEVLTLKEHKMCETGEFSFNYPNYGIVNCSYEICIATRDLDSTGYSRGAGLLICAGPFSVLDCTLFGHGGRHASRFFGKVLLSGDSIRSICKNEKIVDDQRSAGLIKMTPLYRNLYKRLHPILEELIEKERKRLMRKTGNVSKGIIENKIDLIKEFNKIDRKETEESTKFKGDIKFDPGSNGIRFCVPDDYLKLTEKQERGVHIVADTSMIPDGSEIELKQDKEGISIDPKDIVISKKDIDDKGIFKRKISFKSDTLDAFLVTAYVKGMLNKTELNIDVIRDPRIHIKKPIEFVSSKQDIVTRKKKNFPLIINFSKVKKNEKISLDYDNKLFNITKKLKLSDAEQIHEDFYELILPIYCSGKPNQQGVVTVEINGYNETLRLNIIHPRDKHLRGDFEGIDENRDDDPDELSYYDKKIIYISINHPILRHYRRSKDSEKSIAYRALYSDIIIREFCKALTRKKIKTSHHRHSEDYRVKFDEKYEEIYKKHSARLHKLCINPKILEKLKVK